ncbi:hypothetical protein AB0H42_19620 [Nocardia sp. NPDC050799]|uniref:hypothetical protein n=1 Tax=Nocardia sp. NPDC050799 TaxID=3154842 RepID=UPI0033ED0D3C
MRHHLGMIVSSLAAHRLIALYETRPPRSAPPAEVTGPPAETGPAPTSAHGGDCTLDSGFASLDEALRERAAHRDHAPLCHRYLGAIAYLGGLHDDSYE